jgi:hypothetical protein
MSLVEYSPELHDLITVSLHHFEDDTIREGFVHNETIPLVRVDPESRSAHFRIQSGCIHKESSRQKTDFKLIRSGVMNIICGEFWRLPLIFL